MRVFQNKLALHLTTIHYDMYGLFKYNWRVYRRYFPAGQRNLEQSQEEEQIIQGETIKIEKSKGVFVVQRICPYCNRSFKNQPELDRHIGYGFQCRIYFLDKGEI